VLHVDRQHGDASGGGDKRHRRRQIVGVVFRLQCDTELRRVAIDHRLQHWRVSCRRDVLRPLKGAPPTIDLVMGYARSNTSPLLKRFLARTDELIEAVKRSTSLAERR